MTELGIKDTIASGLNEKFSSRFAIRDFPIDLSVYKPKHPNGEILIKSLGHRPIDYVNPHTGIEQVFEIADFVIDQFSYTVTLVCRESYLKSQDMILDLSEETINIMQSIYLEPDNFVEARGFIFSDANEPEYDGELKCHIRILTFTISILKPLN